MPRDLMSLDEVDLRGEGSRKLSSKRFSPKPILSLAQGNNERIRHFCFVGEVPAAETLAIIQL
jgi:hypothetical protein